MEGFVGRLGQADGDSREPIEQGLCRDSLDSSLPWVAQNDISVEDAAISHENVILNPSASSGQAPRSEVKNPDGADLEGMLEVKMDGLQGSRKGRFQRTDRARVAPGFSGFPFDSPAARSGQAFPALRSVQNDSFLNFSNQSATRSVPDLAKTRPCPLPGAKKNGFPP